MYLSLLNDSSYGFIEALFPDTDNYHLCRRADYSHTSAGQLRFAKIFCKQMFVLFSRLQYQQVARDEMKLRLFTYSLIIKSARLAREESRFCATPLERSCFR